MRRSQFFCIAVAIAMSGIVIRCNNNNPASPQVVRNVIMTEGFEDAAVPLQQLTFAPGWGVMSKSTACAHTGKYSLASDSIKTGIKEDFGIVTDSMVGMEFYLKATKAEQNNFYAAIARAGSAWNGLFAIVGLGISKSDSLMYVFQINPEKPELNEQKCFAALQTNKWYKCLIEFDFATNIATYSMDGQVVATKNTSANPMMMLQYLVTCRDEFGSQGQKGYYIDDVTVYKR